MSAPASGNDAQRMTEEATAGVNIKKIMAVGVVSLVLFALAVAWAAVILKRDTARLHKERGAAAPRALAYEAEINIVDFVDFGSDARLKDYERANQEKLTGYSWYDREAGLVRVPVDQAIEQFIAENESADGAVQSLPWRTGPSAPGTLEVVIGALKAGQSATSSVGESAPVAPETTGR